MALIGWIGAIEILRFGLEKGRCAGFNLFEQEYGSVVTRMAPNDREGNRNGSFSF